MHDNFYHKVKVYYEDTDAGGIVYYANYLKYLERARTEALSTIGLSNLQIKDKYGALIIVKSCNIEYKNPSYLEDVLSIRSFIKSVTKTSFIMNQIITKNENVVAEAKIHLVFINEKRKPIKVPEIIFNNFKPYFCESIKS
jgi:acyl-CoA thioester hydrolase